MATFVCIHGAGGRASYEPVEIPGGHCAFLSQPRALAEAVLECWADVEDR